MLDCSTFIEYEHEDGLATRIGVDPAALGRWATPTPDHAIARDVRNTVKAKYAPTQWRQVAQPIFDRLRQQRRDALVAQVLQVSGYQRVEQLFEHFLIDPATEPVVQTSRLRLAMSSLQTFVQRCLLSLEPNVASSSINADHWEWMKRYRVWEANRKIFLWPENWLEPEFRDDKSHLFAELESALLESDLGREAVEAALHGYLAGLEKIARLDIRAIHREQRPSLGGDVLHVLARTPGTPHQYFHRRWVHRSWTPWQPISTEIAGDHVVLVVWRSRVHLFWTTFVPQAEASSQGLDKPSDSAGSQKLSELVKLKPKKKVDVLLYWCSLFQGEWSDPVLAEPDQPQTKTVDATFNARRVFIWADVIGNAQVSISLLGEGVEQSFRVRSPYAPPEQSTSSYRVPLDPPYLTGDSDEPLDRAGQGRWAGQAPTFAVHVEGHTSSDGETLPCDMTQPIFSRAPSDYRLVMIPPPAKASKKGSKSGKGGGQPEVRADDPYFYLDAEHTFFVEPDWAEFSIPQADQAVVAQSPVWHDFDPPEVWRELEPLPAFPQPLEVPPRPVDFIDDGPELLIGDVLVGDALAGDVSIRARGDRVTRPDAVIDFGGSRIGASGRLDPQARVVRIGPHGALVRSSRGTTTSPGSPDLEPHR